MCNSKVKNYLKNLHNFAISYNEIQVKRPLFKEIRRNFYYIKLLKITILYAIHISSLFRVRQLKIMIHTRKTLVSVTISVFHIYSTIMLKFRSRLKLVLCMFSVIYIKCTHSICSFSLKERKKMRVGFQTTTEVQLGKLY